MLTPPRRRRRPPIHVSAPRVIETYCVGDSVYTLDSGTPHVGPQLTGTLAEFARSHVEVACAAFRRDGPLVQIRQRLARLPELSFCLLRLVPLLRSWSGVTRPIPPVEPVAQRLAELEQRAQLVQAELDRVSPTELPPVLLRRYFRVPRAIAGNISVPLEPITTGPLSRFQATLGGQRFRWRMEAAELLANHWTVFEQGVASYVVEHSSVPTTLERQAQDVLDGIDALLDWYRPRQPGAYDVIYCDDEYQLQLGRFGDCLVVRGPLSLRVGIGSAWVAVRIQVGTREQMLATVPGKATDPKTFWTPQGRSSLKGLCMGSPGQYGHLLAPSLTDSDAILRRLDACAILATKRTELHRRLRTGTPLRTPHDIIEEFMRCARRRVHS